MSITSRLAASLYRLHFPRERLPCDLSLYLVANRPSFEDEDLFLRRIQEAVRGGVSCVQLRDHKSDYPTSLELADRLKKALGRTPLFINTFESVKLAQAIGAAGVYLEEGPSPLEARKILGEKAIIGAAVKTMDEVVAVNQTNAIDYLSVKVSLSKRTCPRNDALWGTEGLRRVRSLSSHRIVAIGGLNVDSVEDIYRNLRWDDGVAMAGGLMEESDPCLTAQKIQAIRKQVIEQR